MKLIMMVGNLKNTLLTLSVVMFFALETFSAPRVHCEEDSLKALKLIEIASIGGKKLGDRMVAVAKSMEGMTWAPPADNDSLGTIMVNFHGMDRLDFINNVIALAKSGGRPNTDFEDYGMELEKISRHKGKDEGFASRFFYASDWIQDNVFRGNIKEMTEYLTGGGFKTKTLDYMTRHKDEFPAMANPEIADKIRFLEMGFRSHRIPHMKKQSAGNKPLHELMENGDIIVMLSPEPDFDIYDIGIVEMREGEPYLIHISRNNGNVTSENIPLSRLFKLEGQHFYGYRWLKPVD